MSCVNKLISFGNINKYISLVFSAALVQLGIYYLYSNIKNNDNFDSKNNTIVIWNGIICTFLYSLGLTLSIILFFIYKICNKRKKNQSIIATKETNSTFIHASERTKSISKLNKFLWILLISVIDIISIGLENYLIYKDWKVEQIFCSWNINIFIMSLFSYFILKIKLYKHHYFSIIIINAICILLNIVAYFFYIFICDINFSTENYFLIYLTIFICITLHCLLFVIFKYFMQKTYMKSYEILFFQGLIELVLSIIIITLVLIFSGTTYDFQYFYNKILKEELINFFLLILLYFGFYSQLYIIIDIFSPYHIFLVILICCGIAVLINPNFYTDTNIILISIDMICFCIVLFFVLVFIEIIEINCCGLSYMTKKNIELRAKIDMDRNTSKVSKNTDIEISFGGYIIELDDNYLQRELSFLDKESLKEK